MIPRTAPIVLTSNGMTFAAGAATGLIAMDTGALRNIDAVGIMIDQLTFGVAGAFVPFIRLRYHNEPITNGWVPAIGFCPVINDAFDSNGSVGVTGAVNLHVVRLTKPIYLGPGEWIEVSSTNPLGSAAGGSTVTAYAQGRFADPPNDRWLPYFSSFVGTAQDGNSNSTFNVASTPQDLGNPFPDRSLIIEHLMGRVVGATAGLGGPFTSLPPDASWPPFNLRISDDQSRWWIPTPTPIHAATNVLTRSWRLNYSLPANSFLRVEIEGTATWTSGAFVRRYALPIVGMVGYRRIG